MLNKEAEKKGDFYCTNVKEDGRAAGMAEEKIATAKRLLAMGLNTSQVAQGAGLSMEEVEKLL